MPESPLTLSADDITARADVAALIAPMRAALLAEAQGRIELPPRAYWQFDNGALRMLAMSARAEELKLAAFKFLTLVDGNRDRGLPGIIGELRIMDGVTGAPRAILAAGAVTLLRTAACSAVATDLLAAPGAARLAVFGSGPQALAHVAAMRAVRPIKHVLVLGRDRARLESFAAQLRRDTGLEIVCGANADLLARADILCTTTNADAPLFQMGDIQPRAHINAIGSYTPAMCELPGDLLRAASVYVDCIHACAEEAGDLIAAYGGSDKVAAHVKAIGDLVATPLPRRPEGRTVYKSVGNAGQDLYAAAHLLARV
jgi:ornithine cyclodeaminase